MFNWKKNKSVRIIGPDEHKFLTARQAQFYLSNIIDKKDKFKSDIKPFDGMDIKKSINYKLEKEGDTWYLRIHQH